MDMVKSRVAVSLFFLALTISFVTVALAADNPPNLIGQKYFKDYTKELKAPSCKVEDASEPIEKTRLTLLFAECQHRPVLLLSKTSDSGTESSIVHQLTVRKPKAGEAFHNNGPYCYFGENKEKRISFVGIFKGWKKTKPMTLKNGVVVEGWMVNPKTEKIEPVRTEDLEKISCLDERGGDE
jgi:hypothetical protein